ncbi:MAG TPA: M23 family metallopeptidase [Candidatus Limnocylindrales bacterium]|nr:M23 family metallopeptidase [Candidatus Limnocylindrales bacterium]
MARRMGPGRLGGTPGPDIGRALGPLDTVGRVVRPVALLGVLIVVVATAVTWPGVAAVGRTVDPGPSAAPHIAVLRGGLVGLGESNRSEPRPAAVAGTIPSASVSTGIAAGSGASTSVGGTSFLGADAATVALAVAQTSDGVLIRDPVAAMGKLYPARLMTGPYGPDGELRPAAPLIMASYTVRAGDTLYTIAAKYGLQFGSLWWANKLTDPRTLHVGQVLRIPPVDGVVYKIKKGDTVESIAADYHVTVDDIVEFNALTTDAPPAGEEIMIPDASGPPLPKPATPKPIAGTSSSSLGTTAYHGKWVWPVPGGRISQYFHASHPALDIAAPMGTRVLAAAPGKVIYAGWGNNGGGYQVWISHGGNLYTTYNHMELVSVRVGQVVKAGQQVGRVGMTGWATGPHCHFEVWIGKVWHGGYRVNPLNYIG